MNTIKKIVLTGGPCAGKTTALVKIIDHFSGLGYKVFTIPEVPTMFTQAGMNYLTKNEKFFFEGEKATFLTQIGLEESFTKMAETIDKPVIIVLRPWHDGYLHLSDRRLLEPHHLRAGIHQHPAA